MTESNQNSNTLSDGNLEPITITGGLPEGFSGSQFKQKLYPDPNSINKYGFHIYKKNDSETKIVINKQNNFIQDKPVQKKNDNQKVKHDKSVQTENITKEEDDMFTSACEIM